MDNYFKPGRVPHLRLEPNPFVNFSLDLRQALRLETGDVELHSGHNSVRIWVDAE